MSDEDALGVISNPSTAQEGDEQQQQQNGAVASNARDDEDEGLVEGKQTQPVTPKSFHSTRSSFKKTAPAKQPQQQQQQQKPEGSHIYECASSLNSSRSSSLHQVNAPTVNLTGVLSSSSPCPTHKIISPPPSIPTPTPLPAIESSSSTNILVNNNSTTNNGVNNLRSIPMVDLADNMSYSYSDTNVILREPIVIRGAGNLTIFGVCNKFSEQFPAALNAKLAPEEFRDTIKQINSILNKELENSFKWLVVGSLFCCCTLGCSLLPVIYLNKKAKLCINKLLDIENQRLYNKLGLRWRLTKLKCNSNSLFEYVLLIDFLPVLSLYQPD